MTITSQSADNDTEKENKPSLQQVDHASEIKDVICDRVFAGETLSEICRDPAMPGRATVDRWLKADPRFFANIVSRTSCSRRT
jgi:hypothetical protein